MFDPLCFLMFFLHLAALAGAVVWACRRWSVPWRDLPLLIYVLGWADFVLAGHMTSVLHEMDSLWFYVPASLLAMAGLLALFRYVHLQPATAPLLKPPEIPFALITNTKARKTMFWLLCGSLALMFLASVVIAVSVYPDNADSMIYRLPRAFWYVSHGSFTHPFEAVDKRTTFYPIDGVALYVPLILYNLPGTFHNFPSLVTWMIVVYATYRFARELGADRLIALFSAWLVGLTPGILAQSISTNDEILCAAALLIGLYMGWRWITTGRHEYFFLAAMSVGLSVGTKLHIVFLAPIVAAMLAVAFWHIRKKPESLKRWIGAVGWRTGAVAVATAVVMGGSFLVYNYVSCGRMYFLGDFAHDVFNLRASVHGMFQNLLIYLSQMVFSPIADLNSWPVANDRQVFNTALNAVTNPFIMPFIDMDRVFYHFTYRFSGVTIPTSVRFVEFSLWSGFIWLLWPFQARLALRQRQFPLRRIFFLIAMIPPLWLLLWSASTLYMEGTATYFTYYLVCAAPAAAFAFAPIRRALWNDMRWIAVVIVAVTSFVIDTNMFMFSGFRALPDLVYAKTWPFDWDLAEAPIISEIRKADRIRIIMSHEKMPYFAFMHWHPDAKYYTPYPVQDLPDSKSILQILPTPSPYMYGYLPLKIPGKETTGLTYLGTLRGIGREVIFAAGNNVHERWPMQSDYILLHVVTRPKSDGAFSVALDSGVSGLSDKDRLEFSYDLTINGHAVFHRDWDKNPGFTTNVDISPFQFPNALTLIVRSELNHKELTRATYPIAGQGAWLPEVGEY